MQYNIQRFVRESRIANKIRKAPNKIYNEPDERWVLRKIYRSQNKCILFRDRVHFATEYLGKPDYFWETIIFSDESKNNLSGSDGRVCVWRKPNTKLQIQNLCVTVRRGVW